MTTKSILLDSVPKVKSFVDSISGCRCGARIVSGSHNIDARSLMGIFSLDVSKPVDLVLEGSPEDIDQALEAVRAYAA